MTLAQRRTLEAVAARDLPLNRAIRAMLEEIDELKRRLAECESESDRRAVRERSNPEGAEGRIQRR